jgi:NADPH:quinone reductase-like Zn-dependent oxidoreductase
MRAVVVRSFGGPDALEITDVPVPVPGPGQVRIRVAAAAVNPVDVATRGGYLTAFATERAVTGIGWDVAGEIDEVGVGVIGLRQGDRVIGLSDLVDLPLGTYADAVVLDADAVAPAPESATPAQASTLPLNGLTALQVLDLLDFRPNGTVLVTGAAGGLGGFVTELAAARGWHVVATAGPADEDLVRSLGAQDFVPRGVELAPAVRALVPGGVHAVVDAAVLGIAAHSALCGGGTFVAVIAGVAPPPLRGTRVVNVWIRANDPRLADLVSLVDKGELTLRVAETVPLDSVADAHRRFEAGGVRGRLVLEP